MDDLSLKIPLVLVGLLFAGGIAAAVWVNWPEGDGGNGSPSSLARSLREGLEGQEDIDSLFTPCSTQWITLSAERAVDTVDGIAGVDDEEGATRAARTLYADFCESGNEGAFCEGMPAWLNTWTDTEVPESVEPEQNLCALALQPVVVDRSTPGALQIEGVTVGDCVVYDDELTSLEVVGCLEPYAGSVRALIQLPGPEAYPGEELVAEQAEEACTKEVPLATYFYPSKASWNVHQDREVICIIEAQFYFRAGDCFVYSSVLLKSPCDGQRDGTVVDAFDMPGDAYPGDDAVDAFAAEECPAETDSYLYPTAETWPLGDRLIACLNDQTDPLPNG
jgi:hypothetical protein